MNHIIMAIHVTNRVQNVNNVQACLTEYGCYIKTRLGLHDATGSDCSPNGLIILELVDNQEKADELRAKLNTINGIEAKQIVFGH